MPNKYGLCDFCHKAKPAKDLERITVTYKKCRSCLPGSMAGQMENLKEIENSPANVGAKTPKKKVIPPAFIREAFVPPSEFTPKPEVLNPTIPVATSTAPPEQPVETKPDEQAKNTPAV